MSLAIDYLNERVELLDPEFGPGRRGEYQAVSRLYNRHLGPVTSVVVHRPEATDQAMYTSAATHIPMTSLFPDVIERPRDVEISVPGGGKGGEAQKALLGGLGEMSERLLAALHFQTVAGRLVFGTCAELRAQGRRALGPRELPLFAPEQYETPGFPYAPFEEDTRLAWIEGTELGTGEPVLAPAQIVLLYYRRQRFEPAIGYPTTGGLAFHSNAVQAVLHGTYEAIERDAINLTWHSRIPPRRVRVDLERVLRGSGAHDRPRLEAAGIDEVHVVLNTVDVPIPVFSTIAIDRTRADKAFLAGGGAWSTRERALSQSVFELGQCRNILKFHRPSGGKHIRADSRLDELTEFFDAVVFYGYRENLPRVDWYYRGAEEMEWEDTPTHVFASPEEELEAMRGVLGDAGLRPIVFDLSGACWPGVKVLKTLIPEITQAGVPAFPFLGHPRYYELPRQLGRTDRPLAFRELNHTPVPLP